MPKKTTEGLKGKAWALLLTAHAVLVERVELAFAVAGLPPLAWYDVLWALEQADDGRLRMHKLAQRGVITRSNLTRLVDRLESAGLIARKPCPDDRRGAYAVLSGDGRVMRKKMWPVYNAEINALFSSHLTDSEARQLVASFTKLIAGLQNAPS